MARLFFILFFGLIFFLSYSADAYKAVFDLKVGKYSVGSAMLQGWADKTFVSFHISPVPFYSVRYKVLAYLDKDGTAYREDILNIRNTRSNSYTILINGGKAIRTNVIPPSKEFVRDIKNRWAPRKPVSVFVVIDRFIRDRKPYTSENVMLMRELIDEVKTKAVRPGTYQLSDVDERFIFEIDYKQLDGHLLPQKIRIVRYRLYGINWSIVNLQLVDFSPEGSSTLSGGF